jgi:superfamily I DNA and/or RNA helicase
MTLLLWAGMEFPVVLLDEASQMSEPFSLLPLMAARARRLVMVGIRKSRILER